MLEKSLSSLENTVFVDVELEADVLASCLLTLRRPPSISEEELEIPS